MPNPLSSIVERIKPAMPRLLAQWQREIVGFAHDYWKDGKWEKQAPSHFDEKPRAEQSFDPTMEQASAVWQAKAGEVSEKMWGQDFILPGDDAVTALLMTPLAVTKDMHILDLSAGLGGRMRKAHKEYGVALTGMEQDADIAKRGLELSVASALGKKAALEPYNPTEIKPAQKYDGVLAREIIYRVADKEKFIQSIAGYCKPKAQVSFTDYIVNVEMRDQPAIVAWRAFEQGADPSSLVDMAALWGKAGISIRVHDDQTDFYKKEIKNGLISLTRFLASGVVPDAETKKTINKQIALWAHRMAALESGLKFYRFYGMK